MRLIVLAREFVVLLIKAFENAAGLQSPMNHRSKIIVYSLWYFYGD